MRAFAFVVQSAYGEADGSDKSDEKNRKQRKKLGDIDDPERDFLVEQSILKICLLNDVSLVSHSKRSFLFFERIVLSD